MDIFIKMGLVLLALDIIGFNISLGAWIFASSLMFCYVFSLWLESRKEKK